MKLTSLMQLTSGDKFKSRIHLGFVNVPIHNRKLPPIGLMKCNMYFLYHKSLREFSYMRLTKCISVAQKSKKYPKSTHFTCGVLECSVIIYQGAYCTRACINLPYFTCVCFKKVLWLDKNTLIQASINVSRFFLLFYAWRIIYVRTRYPAMLTCT